jgi:hypothetical protein
MLIIGTSSSYEVCSGSPQATRSLASMVIKLSGAGGALKYQVQSLERKGLTSPTSLNQFQ